MHKLPHPKSALPKPLSERRRLVASVFIAFVGFTAGALMPSQRVLAGAAVAAAAVALAQLIFSLIDQKDAGASPPPPADPPGSSDLV